MGTLGGLFLVVMGGLLTLTIIGAILGIPMLLSDVAMMGGAPLRALPGPPAESLQSLAP